MLVSIYGGSVYAGLLFFSLYSSIKIKRSKRANEKKSRIYIYIDKICSIIYLYKEKKYAYRGKIAEF